jgi:RND family efflux transporter MFP subunit
MKITILAVSVLAAILFASCTSGSSDELNAPMKFKVISPLVKDTVYINEYVAEINAFQNVEIRTRVNGFIDGVNVDEGQTVRKGQTLFTIGNKQFQQDILKAEAATKSAYAELRAIEIELEGARKLLEKDFISKSEYDLTLVRMETLKAKWEEAKSDESMARLNLSYAQVKAPFDGIINRIPNKTGSLVEEGALLTTISNNKEVFVYFNVSERDYLDYALSKSEGESKEVTLVLANGAAYNQTGIIETTESEFNKSTGTIAFRARFPNPDQVLKHGSSGKIQLKTIFRDALLIPQKSTFDRQEYLCVYVVNQDSIVQVRKIVPLVRLPQLLVIGQGLSQKDRIIYEGVQLVKEGDKIVPDAVSLNQFINNL